MEEPGVRRTGGSGWLQWDEDTAGGGEVERVRFKRRCWPGGLGLRPQGSLWISFPICGKAIQELLGK